jgi:glycosyltransferase involved in cell wall biosynthesis
MRILYFIPRYHPATGGAGIWARELLMRVAHEHDVVVVTQWREDTHDYLRATTVLAPETPYEDSDHGIPIHVIAPQPPYRRWLTALSRFYHQYRPVRLLFFALYRQALLPQLTACLADYDLLHAVHIGLVYSSEIAFAAAQAKGIPFVFTPFPHQGGWEGRRFRRLYSLSDAIIAMTSTEKEWLAVRGADPQRVLVCGGGPVLAEIGDAARFRERFQLTGPIVLFVGQRLKHKGYAELIAAMPTVWAQHPVVQFVFIGPMTPEAQPIFAEATKDSRVIDLGIVPIQTKTDALDACTMLCVPSTQESLGLVYIEAWAHGKPVIACDTDVTREVIDVGEDGLLVPQTSSDVARAILQLLNCPHRAAEMGQRGRTKLERKYSWERLSERMIDIYSTAISANSHRSP